MRLVEIAVGVYVVYIGNTFIGMFAVTDDTQTRLYHLQEEDKS